MPLLSNVCMGALRMSKFLSKSATKRLPLNPKHVGKGFYKGKGAASTGRTTSKGERRRLR